MDLITLDFETFYDPANDYTLSKMTTEAYVRDPRFEAILLGIQINNENPFWVPLPQLRLHIDALHLERNATLFHHAHFDALILSHHYGVKPKVIFDTLGMARHLHGKNGRLGLAALCERYGIGAKGDEVHNVKGMRFRDFTPTGLQRYGGYCTNDVVKTRMLFDRMRPHFSREELQINDRVVRMFTEPRFVLDTPMLDAYRQKISAEKIALMLQAGAQKTDLMSNDKFAECLRQLGVDPPLKFSKTAKDEHGNPKLTFAFAKTDAGMQALQEHPDERVQILVEARLKNKTTIAEKGAERLIAMGSRGPATVYLKYSGADGTHRFSGGDLFNWQAMKRGSDLRNAVMADATKNEVVCVVDSSTIEARLLDWLSGQDDMVEVYRKQDAKTGPDMYCTIAKMIYEREILKARDPDERQMGKVAKLGLGFGMGDEKFVFAVRAQAKVDKKDAQGNVVLDQITGKPEKVPLVITREFAKKVVGIYRDNHPQVRKLWKRGQSALDAIIAGQIGMPVDFRGVVKTCKDGLEFPGGIKIFYPDLKKVKVGQDQNGRDQFEYEFWNGKHRERIYGAKVIENIIQCLARITVMRQCLDAEREVLHVGAEWKHSVHDEGIFVSPVFEAPWVLERMMANFRKTPEWAPGLPVNCEGGFHMRYGLAKS